MCTDDSSQIDYPVPRGQLRSHIHIRIIVWTETVIFMFRHEHTHASTRTHTHNYKVIETMELRARWLMGRVGGRKEKGESSIVINEDI